MQQVLSSEELHMHLNNFRQTLQQFDYSDIKNIRFLNLQSVYAYIEHVDNNPFKRQYEKLQEILDLLQPYLPFVSSERAKQFLVQMASASNEQDVENLKRDYTKKLRMDFINIARTTTNEREWECIMNICEEIRSRKEQMCLH